jgi:hypothetical protein
MYGSAERRGGWSQSEIALHNQTNGLHSVNWLAREALGLYMHRTLLPVGYPPTPSFDGIGHVRVLYLDQYYIFIILDMILF